MSILAGMAKLKCSGGVKFQVADINVLAACNNITA